MNTSSFFKKSTAALLLLAAFTFTEADAQKLGVKSGEVKFHGSTPVENFTGRTTEVAGSLDPETGDFRFVVDLRTLDTGNSRRDRNMHDDYLKTDEYPEAVYEGRLETLPDPGTGGEQEIRAKGTFSLKEREKELEITVMLRYDEDEQEWTARAEFKTLLSDYSISRPRFLMIRMRDEVTVETELRLAE
jgi:polyisoprenoid-binding protein YceI